MSTATHIVARPFDGTNEAGETVPFKRGEQIDATTFNNLEMMERQGIVRPIAARPSTIRQNLNMKVEPEIETDKKPIKQDARPGAALKK